jgi:hypothetical protein
MLRRSRVQEEVLTGRGSGVKGLDLGLVITESEALLGPVDPFLVGRRVVPVLPRQLRQATTLALLGKGMEAEPVVVSREVQQALA